jgi:hypothetical protein
VPLPENAEVYTNKESTKGNVISGLIYVSVHMKTDPPGTLGKILIAKPQNCGHVNRICVNCYDGWADYDILWERTAGGRRLKAEIDARRPN